jgi:hypothetical protein
MDVIRHQAIGIKVERELRLLVSELEQKLVVVIVGSKDELSVIASGDHVIEAALDFESRFAHRSGV